jgi:hypothetical protein
MLKDLLSIEMMLLEEIKSSLYIIAQKYRFSCYEIFLEGRRRYTFKLNSSELNTDVTNSFFIINS